MLRRRTLPGNSKGRWLSPDRRLVYSTHMGYDEPDYDADNPIYRGGQPVEETAYLTDALTREAVDFVNRNADRPFFLYLAYNAVHSPLQGADEYMKRFAHIDDMHRRIFAAMLSNLDDSVGEVLAILKKKKLDRDTLVFFLSDNGGPTRELTSSNAPLRGEKGTVYEGGLRIPFLARWPGVLPAGKANNHPIISLDIFATASAVAGIPLPNNAVFDGVNLLPVLTTIDAELPDRPLYWRTGNRAALRAGEWKVLRNPQRGQDNDWQLFHLKSDIGETRNLSVSHAAKRNELVNLWQNLDRQMIAPVWAPRH